MTVNYFSLVAKVLKETNLISIVPYEAVAESACAGDLHITQPPIGVPPITVTLLWHKRTDKAATRETMLAQPTPADVCGGKAGCEPVAKEQAAASVDGNGSK